MLLLYSWNFFPNSARSHWLIPGHMISNNETVSHQNLWAGNIAKSMTSEGNSALEPVNVDRRPQLQRGLMKQITGPSGKVNFVSLGSASRFSLNKINCFPWDQSLSVLLDADREYFKDFKLSWRIPQISPVDRSYSEVYPQFCRQQHRDYMKAVISLKMFLDLSCAAYTTNKKWHHYVQQNQ